MTVVQNQIAQIWACALTFVPIRLVPVQADAPKPNAHLAPSTRNACPNTPAPSVSVLVPVAPTLIVKLQHQPIHAVLATPSVSELHVETTAGRTSAQPAAPLTKLVKLITAQFTTTRLDMGCK